VTRSIRSLSTGLVIVAHALGAAAFLYPFFLPRRAGATEATAHAGDAPLLFGALAVLTVAIAVAEVRSRRLDARQVALLGVLAGINAVLRLPGGLAGANLMFFLPIVSGYTFGAGFGFLLGASSMAVSAVVTGGVGPWLPFQMWALGWIGAGGGLLAPLRRAKGRWTPVVGLAAYGWVAGLLFGALMNLWSWPYFSGESALAWQQGLGAVETARRYWRFYLVTSLAWDSARAVGNAVLVTVFARPVLRILDRFERRFAPPVFEPQDPLAALPG
jgi:energy-coupling factor transport system substrate-specific component